MRRIFLFSRASLLLVAVAMALPAFADSSHARIVRLSLVEGDVRYTREFHNDPLTDIKVIWESAPLNLPIRQGNVLSTGNGRAEVEFEDGAMGFLSANAILEFYDLSLNDGARVTRLILRQGSASFYDRSQNGDYFSVTGGDFSVEVSGHAAFRLENFENGSTVTVQSGRVMVVENGNATPLEKGHSLSVQAGNPGNQVVTEASAGDDFDRWVSSRIQNEQLVNSQTSPTSSSTSYISGYSDLYTYGSWIGVGGYNYWRPFGLGWAWSPFNDGSWIYDASIGWSFIGSAPWGWLPYHYGGWIYSAPYGWLWNPGSTFHGRPQPYRPVTAVFVKTGNTIGIVPLNVGDKGGKAPLNLAQGIYPLQNGALGKPVPIDGSEKLSVIKSPDATALSSRSATVAAPTRVSRTIAPSRLVAGETTFGRGSSIVYDPKEHRFVNANQTKIAESSAALPAEKAIGNNSVATAANPATGVLATNRGSAMPNSTSKPVALRPPAAPAPARTSSGGSGGGSQWSAASSESIGSSSRSSASSSGSSHPSGGSSGGGGRPH